MSPWFVFICTKDSARKHAIISASCQSVKLSPLELNWILEMLNSFWPFWLITKVWCALHTCLYTTGFKKGCWKKKGRKCTRQSQKVIWASSNQWISTSQKKINNYQICDPCSCSDTFSDFPANPVVKEPWPENYPQYLWGLFHALFHFFWQPFSNSFLQKKKCTPSTLIRSVWLF